MKNERKQRVPGPLWGPLWEEPGAPSEPSQGSALPPPVWGTDLDDVDLLSAVKPDFKLLAVASDVFRDPDGAHLEASEADGGHSGAAHLTGSWAGPASHLERVLEAVGRALLLPIGRLLPLLAEEQHGVVQEEVPLHGLEPGQVLHLQPERPSEIRGWERGAGPAWGRGRRLPCCDLSCGRSTR